ncbi:type VII secretion protein EssA [Peribacillus deserti]|uniref:Type VII secretion protein EssA n=1 Tax=Peribacillus deserti TaxID=673318 RepID=A0A2N5MAV0_9BACI|nr:type VII secretion protein EssA [Peribacillus deserti]PLT31473.1 type VII secretion protein EssA [Peribacillus deserti]
MKVKKAAKIVTLIAVLGILNIPGYAAADDNRPVEPNTYKEKEIDLQTEYFHEDSLLKEKEQLSEEQKMLTFKRQEQEFFEQIKEGLFINAESKTTTVSANASELNLFSRESFSSPSDVIASDRGEERESSFLPLVLGLILTLCILYMFLILVPKMTKAAKN